MKIEIDTNNKDEFKYFKKRRAQVYDNNYKFMIPLSRKFLVDKEYYVLITEDDIIIMIPKQVFDEYDED